VALSFLLWVPRIPSTALTRGSLAVVAPATMWEIGVNSVGNGAPRVSPTPGQTGSVGSPPTHSLNSLLSLTLGPHAQDPASFGTVEEAPVGVEAGRTCGFGLVVGVDHGDHRAELLAHGADIVVNDLRELLDPTGERPGNSNRLADLGPSPSNSPDGRKCVSCPTKIRRSDDGDLWHWLSSAPRRTIG